MAERMIHYDGLKEPISHRFAAMLAALRSPWTSDDIATSVIWGMFTIPPHVLGSGPFTVQLPNVVFLSAFDEQMKVEQPQIAQAFRVPLSSLGLDETKASR